MIYKCSTVGHSSVDLKSIRNNNHSRKDTKEYLKTLRWITMIINQLTFIIDKLNSQLRLYNK